MNVQDVSSKVPTGSERPRLKIAIGTYGHTKSIKDGSVPIEGVDAEMIEVTPIIQAFRCMVRVVLHPGLPYNFTIMKHTGWIATERTVKAHETRPDGRARHGRKRYDLEAICSGIVRTSGDVECPGALLPKCEP